MEITEETLEKYESKYDKNIALKLLKKLREKTRKKPNLISKPVGAVVIALGHFLSALDNPLLPDSVRFSIICAIAYIISPVDLIPDAIPVVGFADDATAAGLVLKKVIEYSTFSLKELDDEIDREKNVGSDDIPNEIKEPILSIEKQAEEDSLTTETYDSTDVPFDVLMSNLQKGNDLFQKFLDRNYELDNEFNKNIEESQEQSSKMWDSINKL